MTAIVGLIILIFLLYAFAGIIAFIPYIGGIIGSFFKFMLDFIKFYIYPVGRIVYVVLAGLLIFYVFWFLYKAFSRSK